MNIYGFGIIKNGARFDFPFIESIESIASITKKFVCNYGICEDQTLEKLKQVENLDIISVDWDDSRTDGGYIFSDMTNIALEKIREEACPSKDRDAWAIYLQSDEVFHEKDLEQIKKDLLKAEEGGYDTVSFRYLHFWQTHNDIAVNKKWYPQEIRAVKVFSKSTNAYDAQTFKDMEKTYQSDVHVYHYGHVRDQKAYEEKIERQIRYHHGGGDFFKFAKKWKSKDRKTKTLKFYGTHPEVMRSRISRIGGEFNKENLKKVYIVDKEEKVPSSLFEDIRSNEVLRVKKVSDVPHLERSQMVIIDPNTYERLFYKSEVPFKMYSKIALDWPFSFYFKMKLYEKGIGTKS